MMMKSSIDLKVDAPSGELNKNIRSLLKLVGYEVQNLKIASLHNLTVLVECYGRSDGFVDSEGELIWTNSLKVYELVHGDSFKAKVDGEVIQVRPNAIRARMVVKCHELITHSRGE